MAAVYQQQISHQPNHNAKLTASLVAAVESGNGQRAAKLVTQLSEQQLKLNIVVLNVDENQTEEERKFKILVLVEDREGRTPIQIDLVVESTDSIADLKRKVWINYDIPMELQRWIVGKKIPDDDTTLAQCGVAGMGHTLYLYLVTAKTDDNNQKIEKRRPTAEESNERIMSTSSAKSTYMRYEGQATYHDSSLLMSGDKLEDDTPDVIVNDSTTSQIFNDTCPPPIPPRRKPTQDEDNSMLLSGEEYLNQIIPAQAQHKNKINNFEGWWCPKCTFVNLPTRPGCEMCATERPEEYEVPDDYELTNEELALVMQQNELEQMTRQNEEALIQENLLRWMLIDDVDLIRNTEPITCPICFDDFEPREGVMLRECMHQFCRECLQAAIVHSEEAVLTCPYKDDQLSCDSVLQDREVRALVAPEDYQKYLQRGLDQAESQAPNSFHCKSTDCKGWCLYEDEVNFFKCPICSKLNCLTCKVIHEGMNCKEYQADLANKAMNDDAAKKTQEYFQEMVKKGSAMHCPQCKIIVQKKDGCDWIKCSVCKMEICWVTKGPRWGPKGAGDASGGCRCRVAGPCHPNCGNCH